MQGATFDYDRIRASVDRESWEDTEGGRQGRGIYLGSVLSLAPSGKYYTAWTSNQTEEDENADSAWYETLETELEARGLSLESGEGDPCDLYAMEYRDAPESDE